MIFDTFVKINYCNKYGITIQYYAKYKQVEIAIYYLNKVRYIQIGSK